MRHRSLRKLCQSYLSEFVSFFGDLWFCTIFANIYYVQITRFILLVAKLSLNLTQSQLKLRLGLALFPVSDTLPSHPPVKVVGR